MERLYKGLGRKTTLLCAIAIGAVIAVSILALAGCDNGTNSDSGSNTGGNNTGGNNTGEDNTGGNNTGGNNTGGNNTGGNNTGEDNTGGNNTGEDNTGGNNTGGNNTGGDNTGGNGNGTGSTTVPSPTYVSGNITTTTITVTFSFGSTVENIVVEAWNRVNRSWETLTTTLSGSATSYSISPYRNYIVSGNVVSGNGKDGPQGITAETDLVFVRVRGKNGSATGPAKSVAFDAFLKDVYTDLNTVYDN